MSTPLLYNMDLSFKNNPNGVCVGDPVVEGGSPQVCLHLFFLIWTFLSKTIQMGFVLGTLYWKVGHHR